MRRSRSLTVLGFVAPAQGGFWPHLVMSESLERVRLLGYCRQDLLTLSSSAPDPKETNSVSGCCNALAQVLQARTLFPRSQKGTLIRRRLAAAHTFVQSLAGHRQARRA